MTEEVEVVCAADIKVRAKTEADSFSAWLRVARITDDPVGDFIRDAKADRKLPKDFRDGKKLLSYLENRSPRVCAEALYCVPHVWLRYKRWRARIV